MKFWLYLREYVRMKMKETWVSFRIDLRIYNFIYGLDRVIRISFLGKDMRICLLVMLIG